MEYHIVTASLPDLAYCECHRAKDERAKGPVDIVGGIGLTPSSAKLGNKPLEQTKSHGLLSARVPRPSTFGPLSAAGSGHTAGTVHARASGQW